MNRQKNNTPFFILLPKAMINLHKYQAICPLSGDRIQLDRQGEYENLIPPAPFTLASHPQSQKLHLVGQNGFTIQNQVLRIAR